jgi:hypothetical protein
MPPKPSVKADVADRQRCARTGLCGLLQPVINFLAQQTEINRFGQQASCPEFGRLICREVQVNLAYRWFCKLSRSRTQ